MKLVALLKHKLSKFKKHWQIVSAISKALPSSLCIDVGASYYPHPWWQVFLHSPNTRWLAIDPNVQNLGYVDSWRWPSKVKKIGSGLSQNGGKADLYVTNVDSGSSLYPPVIGASMTHRIPHTEYFFPMKKKEIDTISLLQIIEAEKTDGPIFIKLDTQGSELDILKGTLPFFDAKKIVGVELESTLVAQPIMVGSGKFWQVTEFFESHDFELLRIKLIQGNSIYKKKPSTKSSRFLNECDAVFALRRDVVATLDVGYRLSLFAFYISYLLYEEALSLISDDLEMADFLSKKGVSVSKVKKYLLALA